MVSGKLAGELEFDEAEPQNLFVNCPQTTRGQGLDAREQRLGTLVSSSINSQSPNQ